MYHFVVEATLAQPGQHFITDYLTARDALPGFRAGMHNVALDEQRHIGFGVKLLRDLALEDPEVPEAVAEQLRAVTPVSLAVFVPPNWDTSYVECFGFTLEQVYEEGARSFEAKFRAAGLPIEELPGPQIMPMDLSPGDRAARGLAMLRAGYLGPPNGPPSRDPASMAMLFDSVRRNVDLRRAPDGPFVLQWDFPDAEPWHVRLDNGSTAAVPGRAPEVDLELRCRFDDWVDVVAGRLDPRKASSPAGCGRTRSRGRCGAPAGCSTLLDLQVHLHLLRVLRAEERVAAGLELLGGEAAARLQRRLELHRALLDPDVVEVEAPALPLEADLGAGRHRLEGRDVEVGTDRHGRRLGLLRLGRGARDEEGETRRHDGGGSHQPAETNVDHWTTISPAMSLPWTAQ